jgi:protein-L-isoaspartate(D-aspartate) O-methyltransferase
MPSPDFAAARANMVDSQVRTDDVTGPALIAALRAVPRELFVPHAKRAVAYMGVPVEIAPGRQMADPRAFAKLAQLAAIRPADVVLYVGAGLGYGPAVLSRLCSALVALEEDTALIAAAGPALQTAGAESVVLAEGKLAAGYPKQAPYDVIFVEGAMAARPETLLKQLAPGGRLVGVVTDKGVGRAHIFMATERGVSARPAFDAQLSPLPGFEEAAGFVF